MLEAGASGRPRCRCGSNNAMPPVHPEHAVCVPHIWPDPAHRLRILVGVNAVALLAESQVPCCLASVRVQATP